MAGSLAGTASTVLSTRVRFSATVADRYGIPASTGIDARVDDTVSEEQLTATWVAWAAALDAIIDGIVTGGRVATAHPPPDRAPTFWPGIRSQDPGQPPGLRLKQTPSGLKTVATERSAVCRVMLFNFGTEGDSSSVLVPARSERFLRRIDDIDVDAEPMQAFIRLLSEPFAAGHGVFTDRHGRPLVGEHNGFRRGFRHMMDTSRSIRAYNRQLRRLTTMPGQ